MIEQLELTIRKIKFSGKYLEFWLDGIPYNKITKWDDKNQKDIETKEDQWNWCCKWYMFENAFKRSFRGKDIHEIFNQSGLDGFIGYKIINHKKEHEFKLKKPITLNNKQKAWGEYLVGCKYIFNKTKEMERLIEEIKKEIELLEKWSTDDAKNNPYQSKVHLARAQELKALLYDLKL